MIAEILPLVAGLASLLAGGVKYVMTSGVRSKDSVPTNITIGKGSFKVTGPISKEELASLIQVVQARADHSSAQVAEGHPAEHK